MKKDIVRQILMLTEMSGKYDFGSFRSKDIDAFIEYYNDNINENKIETLRIALDKLNEAFDDTVKLKPTSISIVCYGMYRIVKDKKGTQKYIDWLKDFLANYDTNEEYRQYCNGAGTASAEMVKGRLNYFRNAIRSM